MRVFTICVLAFGLVACGGGGGGGGIISLDGPGVRTYRPDYSNNNNDNGSSSGSSTSGSSVSSGSSPGGNCNYSWAEVLEKGFGCHTDTGSGGNAAPPPPESRAVSINHYQEYEPNNAAENATIVEFLPVTGDTLQGIEITGTVETLGDDSDYFIFTPERSGLYAIYLCDGGCTEQPTDSAVSLRVLDQFGEVLAENPLYEESTKFLTADFDAGLPYYVQVLGYDTAGETYPYRLVVIE